MPSPDGLIDDSAAPPVAKVTCMYGVNMPTLRTIFLKHRDAHVTGGAIDAVSSMLQLDKSGDVDGLVVHDGQGFETSGVPQVQPDTGKQVFLSGDGTVNYQSLRHAATWKDTCDVSIFELPGCDHRGISSDARMLKLLCGVLGLQQDSQEIEENVIAQQQAAQNRKGDVARWWSHNVCCALIAKSGFRHLNVFRKRFSIVVRCKAVASIAISVYVMVMGVS